MKVILKDYMPNLGDMGEVVEVANGYGRNFLLPRGLAVRASTKNIAQLDHERGAIDRQKSRMQEEATGLAERLKSFVCTIEKAVGESGKLYGSVTAMDLEDRLHEAGFTEIMRRQIALGSPIKELGEHTISIKVHPEVAASFQLSVIARSE